MNTSAMKLFLRTWSLVFLFLYLQSNVAHAQRSIPNQGGFWVHDEAGVLSPQTKAQLEYSLKIERDSSSNQIAILIIPSLEGEDISAYGIRVAEAWKMGTKENDNGVLLLIAIQDKRMRIEVGQGLEGVLTDALSSRIDRNEIAPHFRKGDYEGGVVAGIVAIKKAIKGQYVNTDPGHSKRGGRSPWLTLVIVIIMLIIASRRGGGSGLGGYWAAGMLLGGGGRNSDYGSDSNYGGGGSFGGGGSSDSW